MKLNIAKRLGALTLAVMSLTSCGLFDDTKADRGPNTIGGVGKIPGSGIIGSATLPDGISVNFPALEGKIIGPQVTGNRVLMIGDSVFAGASRRYGGEICAQLVPLGWQVELDAEAGRFIDFGLRVVKDRISDDWDAVVIHLGTNFGNNPDEFKSYYKDILDEVGDIPVLLVTITRYKETIDDANAVIRELAAEYPNASVLDWSKLSSEDGMLNSDRIHPSADGRIVLATSLAKALGTAPTTPGECLNSDYTDDSAVAPDVMPSTSIVTNETTTTVTKSQSTTTTSTTTTVVDGSTTTLPK